MSSDEGYYTCDTCDGTPPLVRPPAPRAAPSDASSSGTVRSAASTAHASPASPTRPALPHISKKKQPRWARAERLRRSIAARRLQALVRGCLARRRDALRRALAPKPKPAPQPAPKLHRFRCARCAVDVALKPAQVGALTRRGVAPTLCYRCFSDETVSFDCAVCASSTRVQAKTYERMRNSLPVHLPLVCPPCHRRIRGLGHGHGWITNAAVRVQCAWRRCLATRAVHALRLETRSVAARRRAALKLQAATRGIHARRCARGLRLLRIMMPTPLPLPAPVPAPAPAPQSVQVPSFAPSREFDELLVEQRVAAVLEQRTAAALAEQQRVQQWQWQQAEQQQRIDWQRWSEQQSRERAALERAAALDRRRSHCAYFAEFPRL